MSTPRHQPGRFPAIPPSTAPHTARYHQQQYGEDPSSAVALHYPTPPQTSQSDYTRSFKAAQDDVAFLAARLKKLKLEESRAKKMIQGTKKKTEEVLRNKEYYATRVVEKQMMKEEIQQNTARERMLIAMERERQSQSIWAARAKLQMERKQNVMNVKRHKEMNLCRIEIEKEEVRDRYLRQREWIREMEQTAKFRRDRQLEKRIQELRQSHQQQVEMEEHERQRNVDIAAKLVTEEAKILYKLQKMEREKQRAIGDLAEAIHTEALSLLNNGSPLSNRANSNSPTRSNNGAAYQQQQQQQQQLEEEE